MNIVRQLFELTLNRRLAEDVDYNANAALIICSLFTIVYYFHISSITEFSSPIIYTFVLVCGHIIAYALLLKTHKKENRLVQTLTSYFGANLILMIPIAVLAPVKGFGLLIAVINIYSMVVSIRILKSSFSCPTYLAITIYFSVTIFSIILLTILCPSAVDEYGLYYNNTLATTQQTGN